MEEKEKEKEELTEKNTHDISTINLEKKIINLEKQLELTKKEYNKSRKN